jgi:hypothetical protein
MLLSGFVVSWDTEVLLTWQWVSDASVLQAGADGFDPIRKIA